MNKKHVMKCAAMATTVLLATVACTKHEETEPPVDSGGADTGQSRFVLFASPEGTLQELADYILTVDNLNEGSVSTKGNGIEQDGYRYAMFHKNRVFSLLYGQSNPGSVTSYTMDENGELQRGGQVLTNTVQIWRYISDEIWLIMCTRSLNADGTAYSRLQKIDANNPSIKEEIQLESNAGNGEAAHFTTIQHFNGKIYAAYECSNSFGITSKFLDSTWVRVYSYPDMKLEKVIRGNKTGYIGIMNGQWGLEQLENGDIYGFSGAFPSGLGTLLSNKPSGIVRIKAGADEFDPDYFFNVEEASGGYHIYHELNLGEGHFFLSLYNDNPGKGKPKFAVVNVETQEFRWVEGFPEYIAHIGRFPYAEGDGQNAYVGVVTGTGPYVYHIDYEKAKATRGLHVEAGAINAIGKLEY